MKVKKSRAGENIGDGLACWLVGLNFSIKVFSAWDGYIISDGLQFLKAGPVFPRHSATRYGRSGHSAECTVGSRYSSSVGTVLLAK